MKSYRQTKDIQQKQMMVCLTFIGQMHTHSKLSPDAEENPRINLFARDTAGLDVFAMVDNDYYPHKSILTGMAASTGIGRNIYER